MVGNDVTYGQQSNKKPDSPEGEPPVFGEAFQEDKKYYYKQYKGGEDRPLKEG